MPLGKNIRKFRENRNIFIVQLSKACGLNRTHLGEIELSRQLNPGIQTDKRISTFLNLTIDELFLGEGKQSDPQIMLRINNLSLLD